MATYYIDPTKETNGNGSLVTPYNTVVGIIPNTGDIFLFKCGTTYQGALDTTILAANNLTFSSYGEGSLPKLTSFLDVIPTSNATYPHIYEYALGSNVGGLATENGTPLQCVLWSTNLATTVPLLSPGSYTYNETNFTYYIYPNNSKSVYQVTSILYGAYSTATYSGLTIQNLFFNGYSRHGIQLLNRSNININNNIFTCVGGNSSGGTYVGNGIECSAGCNVGVIYNNTFTHIFDSPITTQIYTNSGVVSNFKIYSNVINDAGLFGIELTIPGAGVTNGVVKNIEVYKNTIKNVGFNFRPTNVTGRGVHVGGNQATSLMTGIIIRDNIIENCRWGISDSTNSSSSVYFINNKVVSYRNIKNVRGIYTSGSTTYIGNLIKGYFYGIGSFGSTADTTTKIYNCIITDSEEAIQQDASAGNLFIKNCVLWSNTRLVRIAVGGLTTTFQYNYWKTGITNGGLTVDGTNTQVSSFPLTTTNTLPVGSPLKWAGIFLNNMAYHNPPSIGAYEYIAERADAGIRGVR